MIGKQTIVQKLQEGLQPLPYVHALWLEGSDASGHDDQYSDIDLWISVDDNMLKDIFHDVEKILETMGDIDFSYELKTEGELGHNVYHITDSPKFLTLDVNTQKLSRKIELIEGIDDATILFDKSNIVKIRDRSEGRFNKQTARERLDKHIEYMSLSVEKNLKRGKSLEAVNYYNATIGALIVYLRKDAGWGEKTDFGLKHIYRDLPADVVAKLENLYFVTPKNIEEKLEELRKWVKIL